MAVVVSVMGRAVRVEEKMLQQLKAVMQLMRLRHEFPLTLVSKSLSKCCHNE